MRFCFIFKKYIKVIKVSDNSNIMQIANNNCFSCKGKTDVDAFGNIVCIECGQTQGGIFDLFDKKTSSNNESKFNLSAWRQGEYIECSSCGSNSLIEDHSSASIMCSSCGTVVCNNIIQDVQDWNNYESNRESGQDNSRVGWSDETNPYATTGSVIKSSTYSKFKVRNKEGKWVVRDLSKIHQIASSNTKEKSFYEVIKRLNSLTYDDSFNKRTVDYAKILWNEIFKKNRIFRGGNRSGILACCVLYACHHLNVPTTREKIATCMYISTDDIVKGEPIFKSIIRETRFKDVLQKGSSCSNRFFIKVGDLGLSFGVSKICNQIYNDCEEELSEISSQSATGGVIAFVVGKVLKQRKPSKKEIAECVGVSVPTVTNSMKIIGRIVSAEDYQ